MSIVFLADDFPPEVGGIQTYVCELARATAELGEEVAVVASGQEGDAEFDADLPYTVIRVPTGGKQAVAAMNLAAGAGHAAGRMKMRPRCIVATKWSPEGPAALLVRGRLRCPLVLLGHGGEFMASSGSIPKWLVQRVVLRRMSLCLANSRFTAGLFRKARVPQERVGVIFGGVDPERFIVSDDAVADVRAEMGIGDRRILLTAARLVQRKGHSTVLSALPEILADEPELLYVIAGDGPMRETIEQQVNELGLQENVLMTGEVEHARLPALYAAAELFVMPSLPVRGELPEGFGLTFLEAAAAGTPSVATDFGGIPDAIENGETGLLVEPGDHEALAAAIMRILGDDSLRRQMGEAARERARTEFSWRRIAELFLYELSGLEHGRSTAR